MLVLGIDIGTSGTRALLVDEAGVIVASATSAHEPFRSPGPAWAEQDPADWWRAALVPGLQTKIIEGLKIPSGSDLDARLDVLGNLLRLGAHLDDQAWAVWATEIFLHGPRRGRGRTRGRGAPTRA